MSVPILLELFCMDCGRAEAARLSEDFERFGKGYARTGYFLAVVSEQHAGVVMLAPHCPHCAKKRFSEETIKVTRENTRLPKLKAWGASDEVPDPPVKLVIACGECGRVDHMEWKPTFREMSVQLKADAQYEMSCITPPGQGSLTVTPLCPACAEGIYGKEENRIRPDERFFTADDHAGKVN
jgi:hypothetical protein